MKANERDSAREAADNDADTLREYALKKYGQDGTGVRKLDPDFDGDGY